MALQRFLVDVVPFLLLLLARCCSSQSAGKGYVTVKVYNNTALTGEASQQMNISSLSGTLSEESFGDHFSLEIVGTVLLRKDVDLYYFGCRFPSRGVYGFLWLDDHLVCSPNVYYDPTINWWNVTRTTKADTTRKWLLRANLYSNGSHSESGDMDWSLQWSFNGNDSYAVVGSKYLSPEVPQVQSLRLKMQKDLVEDSWSQWKHTNDLEVVRMPDSFGFVFGMCRKESDTNKWLGTDPSGYDCLMEAFTDTHSTHKPWKGAKSYDLSYSELNLTYKEGTFGYQVASDAAGNSSDSKQQLYVSMELLSYDNTTDSSATSGDDAAEFYVAIGIVFEWWRLGSIEYKLWKDARSGMNCFAEVEAAGLEKWALCTNGVALNNGTTTGVRNNTWQVVLFPVADIGDVIYFTSNTITSNHSASAAETAQVIGEKKKMEYATYEPYGDLSRVKMAIQSGLMFNWLYHPEEGPMAPVARGWCTDQMFGNVLFDWDNIFASYQLSLDAPLLAYSNLIQIIKAKTVDGFIPNFKWTNRDFTMSTSADRTEPPIGAKVVWEIYNKWGGGGKSEVVFDATWLVEFVFDDLLDWVNWFWRRRRCAPLDLICLGSDPGTDYNVHQQTKQVNTMKGARLESGLDNSPMYDGEFYNNVTHHMLLYDVGMNGMLANEMKYLIKLAHVVGRDGVVGMLQQRFEQLTAGMVTHLWDEEMGVYVNKRSDTGEFYVRISPTSFYPLLSGVPHVSQAEAMVENYLMSPDYFCINLEFPNGQADDCYWGLPSIAKSDANFTDQNYWRGLTWGPMAQLTYWSLSDYAHQSEIVRSGRAQLAKQMTGMFIHIWENSRQVCENFSPGKERTNCTGTPFYHWGGLAGFVSLLEAGFY